MTATDDRIAIAHAQLEIDQWRGRSVVTRAQSAAPLRLLAPRSPGRAAWVYQSSLGGGFVGRDAIELAVGVAAGARLFLTSQSSSKVYRRAASRFGLDATVGDGGVLIAWPDPIACFAGATFEQRQKFRLARGAGLVAVDAWTAGRAAHGECWAFGRMMLRTEVEIDGVPALHEAVVVSPAHGALTARMTGAQAFATVVIAGAPFAEAARAMGERIAGRAADAMPRVAASVWPWGAVVRIAAPRAEPLSAALHDLIGGAVRDALGADPFARKW
ncbi:MAG TPA: urease accessory protein UreD [Kofleriaceae bacterium]|nr:urease accessory protein UreD [Kofleriaceae bacterium]